MSLPHPVLPKTSTTCTSSENRARKYTVNPSLSVTVNSNKNELESTPPSTLGAVKVCSHFLMQWVVIRRLNLLFPMHRVLFIHLNQSSLAPVNVTSI